MGQFNSLKRQVVLVVEDEPLLRMMAVDLVEEAGFDAVEAVDAAEAVDILEARTDIHIVFTDVDMPGSMDGLRLAALIRDRWPPIQIIITSAHVRINDGMIPANTVFFPKPYSTVDVASTLQWMAKG